MRTHSKTPKNIISSKEKPRAELHLVSPDLAKFKRMEKSWFLRRHRDLVIEYLEVFGEDKTLLQFDISKDTLKKLKDGTAFVRRGMPRKDQIELRCKVAIEKVAELEQKIDFLTIRLESLLEIRKEQRELRDSFEQFSQNTASQVTRALLTPLLESLVKQYGGIVPQDSGMLGPVVDKESDVIQTKKCLRGSTRWQQGY